MVDSVLELAAIFTFLKVRDMSLQELSRTKTALALVVNKTGLAKHPEIMEIFFVNSSQYKNVNGTKRLPQKRVLAMCMSLILIPHNCKKLSNATNHSLLSFVCYSYA